MRELNCQLSLQTLKLPHFYRKITFNTLIHLSLHRSRSFPSAPTLPPKVSNILDTAKLLSTFFSKMLYFSKRNKKKASDAATAEKIILPHSYSMTAPMPIYLKLFYLPFPFSSSPPSPF